MSKLELNGIQYFNKYYDELNNYRNPDIIYNAITIGNYNFINWNVIKLEFYLEPNNYKRNSIKLFNYDADDEYPVELYSINIQLNNILDLSKINLKNNELIIFLDNNIILKERNYFTITNINTNNKLIFNLTDNARKKTERFLIKLAEKYNQNTN
jgi:hypothetical protein